MEIEITAQIGDGWSGIIYDKGNKIIFGGYINSKNQLILPTFYYHVKKFESNSEEIKRFILETKPNPPKEYFAKHFYNTKIYKKK